MRTLPIVRGIGLIAAVGLIVWGAMGGGKSSSSSVRTSAREINHTAAPTTTTPSGYYSQVQTPIAHLQVGMRVAAFNPEVTSTQRAKFQDPDPATWRMLELEMPKASGGVFDITMLRPLEWLDAHNIVVGGSVALNMPELGAQGKARVLGVYPCPEIKPGPGQVITATFAHPATFQVLDVTIGEGADAETIGVTETHPFWSVKHDAFVPVGQLTVGDELLTLHGQKKRLTALLPRPGPPERVYNLEVHGEHTYYVGQRQLLVHNWCPDDFADIGSPGKLNISNQNEIVIRDWNPARAITDGFDHATNLAAKDPIIAVYDGKFYHIVQGNHRVLSAAKSGVNEVDAIVTTLDEWQQIAGTLSKESLGTLFDFLNRIGNKY